MIWETFLPRLFFGNMKTLSPIVGTLSAMPIKVAGLDLLNPVASAKEKYLSSQRGSAELIRSVTWGGSFSNANHLRTPGEERRDGKKDREAANKTKLKGLFRDLKGTNRCLILRTKSTGACMSIRGTTVAGTLLSATKFWVFLCAHYNVSILNPQRHCDGCGTASGVTHTLSCSTGGLIIVRHNAICDELLYISQRAFTSAFVRPNP